MLGYNSNGLRLILYYSGFWIKQFSFREQPTIKFKYQYLIVLEHQVTQYFQDSIICTTYRPLLDSIRSNFDHCSSIQILEPDEDKDGKADKLNMEVGITNITDVDIIAAHIFLVFDYKIYDECVYNAEIMTTYSQGFSQPIGKLDLISGIVTNMKKPLDCKARHIVKRNASVFSELLLRSDKHFINRIQSSYASKMVTVDLGKIYSTTEAKSRIGINEPFVISIHIRYDEQVVIYKTRFWQFMKWAWIQYFSIVALFLFISKKIKKFVFLNRILQTIKVHPKDD